MINIHDKIWAVKAVGRDGLAYMCPYNVKRDGTPDSATQKMMNTGNNWAGIGPRPLYECVDGGTTTNYYKAVRGADNRPVQVGMEPAQQGASAVYDNVPMKGFKVGQDATRWTTENKVFRLHDPRGFTVEIPTGNLSTLIQSCTIVNGEIQEECVWGRDGCHILLPVNAPEYNRVVKEITRVEEALKLKDLVPGDWVKLHQHGTEGAERQFLGMVKLAWTQKAELFDRVKDTSKGRYYRRIMDANVREDGEEVIQDGQWVGLFATDVNYKCVEDGAYPGGQPKHKYLNAPGVSIENSNIKIVSRRAGELTEEQRDLDALLAVVSYDSKCRNDCPERVSKHFAKQPTKIRGIYEDQSKDNIRVFHFAKVYKHA